MVWRHRGRIRMLYTTVMGWVSRLHGQPTILVPATIVVRSMSLPQCMVRPLVVDTTTADGVLELVGVLGAATAMVDHSVGGLSAPVSDLVVLGKTV